MKMIAIIVVLLKCFYLFLFGGKKTKVKLQTPAGLHCNDGLDLLDTDQSTKLSIFMCFGHCMEASNATSCVYIVFWGLVSLL